MNLEHFGGVAAEMSRRLMGRRANDPNSSFNCVLLLSRNRRSRGGITDLFFKATSLINLYHAFSMNADFSQEEHPMKQNLFRRILALLLTFSFLLGGGVAASAD